MSNDTVDKIEDGMLIKMIKDFTLNDGMYVKVGILGEKAARINDLEGKSDLTNADIGAIHEFGSKDGRIPARSWLRVPLIDNIQKYMDKLEDKFKTKYNFLNTKKIIEPLLNELGLAGVKIVQEGFVTGGYGKWKPSKKLKDGDTKSGDTLVETGQLSQSISMEVSK